MRQPFGAKERGFCHERRVFPVAAATPAVRAAQVAGNLRSIKELIFQAAEEGCGLVCFPELAVTAYTCGDLFRDAALLAAAEQGLAQLLEDTKELDILCAVGVPVPWEGALYNCAALFHRGRLLGLPAKEHIPNYGEFYEARHFTPAPDPVTVAYCGQKVPLGKGLLFPCENVPGLTVAAELCEDLWGAQPPSAALAQNGATVVLNASCSDEVIGKAEYRRDLVKMWSGHLLCAYVYADGGPGESTTDMVFAGHDLIAENGALLGESQLFTHGLTTADIDLERLVQERRRMSTWQDRRDSAVVRVPFRYREETLQNFQPRRKFSPAPFVPRDQEGLTSRCQLILTMQAQGLATRLSHIGCKSAVIGLSGGLDSTLALLVTVRAFDRLHLDRKGIYAVSMPCFGTTGRTNPTPRRSPRSWGGLPGGVHRESGAPALRGHRPGHGLPGRGLREFPGPGAHPGGDGPGQPGGGIAIGTGDLSELALGWATYNGDHMSMYGVNASVPKTLVRYWCATRRSTAGSGWPRPSSTCWTPRSPRSCCPPRTGRSPKD